MWLTNGKESIELFNEIQIAAFKNSGYEKCEAPVKTSRKSKKEEKTAVESLDTAENE